MNAHVAPLWVVRTAILCRDFLQNHDRPGDPLAPVPHPEPLERVAILWTGSVGKRALRLFEVCCLQRGKIRKLNDRQSREV